MWSMLSTSCFLPKEASRLVFAAFNALISAFFTKSFPSHLLCKLSILKPCPSVVRASVNSPYLYNSLAAFNLPYLYTSGCILLQFTPTFSTNVVWVDSVLSIFLISGSLTIWCFKEAVAGSNVQFYCSSYVMKISLNLYFMSSRKKTLYLCVYSSGFYFF
jgi:hypothetical protein